jgi:hypothetical protein
MPRSTLKPSSAVFVADGYKLAKQAYAHGVRHLHQVAHQLGALVRRVVLKRDLEPTKRTSI